MSNSGSDVSEMEIRGKKLLDRGQFDKAKELFDRILESDPENLFALDKIGVIYARRGILEEAESWFRTVLSIDSRYKTSLNNLGNVLLEKGELLVDLGNQHLLLVSERDEGIMVSTLVGRFDFDGHLGNMLAGV